MMTRMEKGKASVSANSFNKSALDNNPLLHCQCTGEFTCGGFYLWDCIREVRSKIRQYSQPDLFLFGGFSA